MPDLALSKSAVGALRPAFLYNMYLEPDETASDGFARVSRQGLGISTTVGAGPINGLFSRRGVFGDALFTISDTTLYRDASSLGAITGTGASSMAASSAQLVATRGAFAHHYNGTNLAPVTLEGGDFDVSAVAYLGGYFIYLEAGTHHLYWAQSSARDIDGFDFASAESAPDQLLDAYVVSDSLWLMGSETVEAWQLTGDADAPFARIEGLLLKKGIKATGCAAELDNTLFWWGHDDMIYRGAQGAPLRISDNGIEEQLKGSVLKEVFSFTLNGHAFLCVNTDGGTYAADVSHPQPVWSQFGSYERTTWRAHNSATPAGDLVFGDDTDGTVWAFDPTNWSDDSVMVRMVSAGFQDSGNIVIHKLGIVANSGATPVLLGTGSDPLIEVRASRDNGQRWGDWRHARLGAQGRYSQRSEVRRFGLFDRQGAVFQLRVSDPVPFRIVRAFANDPSGGRASV